MSYTYWGFISYSRHDARVARWLKDTIQSRRAPASASADIQGAPRHFKPLFLDETEIELGSQLDASLKRALDASRHLIVVCSPFAVQSRYVAAEVAHFVQSGRADDIICVVASGTPNAADPALEALPAALRYRLDEDGAPNGPPIPEPQRPLAAVLGQESPEEQANALELVCARLSGMSRSAYRDHLDRRRTKQVLAAGAALLLVAAACVGVWAAAAKHHVRHHDDYVRVHGIWEGVGAISADHATQRQHYAFHYRGTLSQRPTRVDLRDGFGNCPTPGIRSIRGDTINTPCNNLRACSAVFEYEQDGTLSRETLLDQYGNPIESLVYDQPAVGIFTQAGFGCSTSKSGIRYVQFQRSETPPFTGLDTVITYLAEPDDPRPTDGGYEALRLEWLPDRRLARQRYVDPDDPRRIVANATGKIGEDYRYDAQGNRVEQAWVRGSGEHFHVEHREFDDLGRAIRVWFTDGQGEARLDPGAHEPQKVFGYTRTFDAHGRSLTTRYLDAKGQAMVSATGSAAYRNHYDANGHRHGVDYLGLDGRPTPNRFGDHGWRARLDAHGNQSSEWKIGADGQPWPSQSAVATTRRTWNRMGYKVAAAFFDTDDNPARSGIGVHRMTWSFDPNGNVSRLAYFDPAGQPVVQAAGYASLHRSSDANGNWLEEWKTDVDGAPVATGAGKCWKTRRTLDSHGRVTRRQCIGLDSDGNEMPLSERRFAYSDRGLTILTTLHGKDGHRQLNARGFSGWTTSHDERGNVLQTMRIDNDNQPVMATDGYAGWQNLHDQHNRKLGVWFLDAGGNRVQLDQGHHGWRRTHDRRGFETAFTYVDADGNPTNNSSGYARIRYDSDVFGRAVRIRYLDHTDQPVTPDGFFERRDIFDERGNMIRRTYHHTDGRLTVNRWGYASWTKQYDLRGNELEKRHFGVDGEPVTASGNDNLGPEIHLVKKRYDQYNRVIEASYWGTDTSSPAESLSGVHRIETSYKQGDARRQRFDAAGQAVASDK